MFKVRWLRLTRGILSGMLENSDCLADSGFK